MQNVLENFEKYLRKLLHVSENLTTFVPSLRLCSHLLFTIYHLPFTIYHLLFTIYYLPNPHLQLSTLNV